MDNFKITLKTSRLDKCQLIAKKTEMAKLSNEIKRPSLERLNIIVVQIDAVEIAEFRFYQSIKKRCE